MTQRITKIIGTNFKKNIWDAVVSTRNTRF